MQKTIIPIALLIALTACTAFGQFGPAPVISGAAANFAVNPPALTITGQNFGAVQPTVTVDGIALPVHSFTQTVRRDPSALAFDVADIWAANYGNGTVSRL
jgi:hypothetical protein